MITLTEAAIKHTKQLLTARGKGIGIRVGTKRNGCLGLEYVIDYVDVEPEEFMFEFDNDDIKVFVDPKDYEHLNGLKLDYTKEGLNEGFRFVNPNETASCGCGESFSTS